MSQQTSNTEYDLPERESVGRQNTARKMKFEAASKGEAFKDNTFPFVKDGQQQTGVLRLQDIRINRIAVRPQDIGGVTRMVVTTSMIFDNEIIGWLDADGNFVPHDLYAEGAEPGMRYYKWNNREKRPHRIHATQWVQPNNFGLLREWTDSMHERFEWRIIERPQQSETRDTQDLYIAIPPGGGESNDPNENGILCDAIEVSVNPKYKDGFVSLIDGLDQQQERWDFAVGLKNKQQRDEQLKAVAQNVHFLGGVYTDKNGDTWARPTDVGTYWIGGTQYQLYTPKGTGKLSDNIFDGFNVDGDEATTASRGATAPSDDELDLPDPDKF